MLVFDKESLRCVVPPTADCDIPTTQIPPEMIGVENLQGQGQQQQQHKKHQRT